MTSVLEVQHLRTSFTTEYGEARAVDDVSFSLAPGETLGIVGESGSGKTVTALSILRLIAAPPGRIAEESIVQYGGANLLKLAPKDLRRVRGAEIAMVFQEPTTSLNPVLTIGTQITETILAHQSVTKQAARERAVDLLTRVGIPDPARRVDEYPHELSGGMQQRVMIAIALSCNPKILIADEPTTALDVTIQAQILELLTELKRQTEMAMVLITHDLGVVAGLADRIAVMYGGQIVEVAPTATLFERPTHPYTEALLRAGPRLDRPTERLSVVPGVVPAATNWPSACRFHPRCPHAWERCSDDMPPLAAAGPEQKARCWLLEQPERRKP